MPNFYQHFSLSNCVFAPATLGFLLKNLNGFFDSIPVVEFSTLAEIEAVLREQMHPLEHSLPPIKRKSSPDRKKSINLSFHWAKTSDLVLWIQPPKELYHGPVLFSSYAEFVQWLQGRLRATKNLNQADLAQISLEMESLKVKITSPRLTGDLMRPNLQTMTSDLELI